MSSSGEKRRRLSLKSPDNEVSDDRKNPSQRPFSEEDEIRLLNAFLKISKTAKSSPSPVATASSLFDRIGETLSCDVSQTLLMKKLRRLRRKYSKQINKKSRSMKMKTPHERNVFQICQEIWGGEESEEEEKRSSSRSAEEHSPSVCVNNQRENSETLTDDPVAEMAAPEYVPVPMEEASRLPRGLGKSDLKRKEKSEEQAEERSPSVCVNNRRENSETPTDDPVAEMAAPEYVPVLMEEASRLPRGLGKSDLKRKEKSEEQAEERSPSVCVNNRRENSETPTDDPVAEMAAPEYVPVPMEEASRLPRGLGKSDLKRKEKSEEQEEKRSSSRSAEERSPSICVNNRRENSETLTDDPVAEMAAPEYVPVPMEEASRLPRGLGKSDLKRKERQEEKRSSSRSAEERSPSVCVNKRRENSKTLTDDPVAEMGAPEYVPVPMEEASRLPRGLGKSDLKRKERQEEKRSSSRSAEERSPSVCVNKRRENSKTLTDDPVAEMAAPEYVPVPMEEASRLPRGLGKSDLKRKEKSEEQEAKRSSSRSAEEPSGSETLTDDPVEKMAVKYVPVPMEEASRLPGRLVMIEGLKRLGKSDLKGLNERWRLQKIAEMEILLKRAELIQEQGKLIMEAFVSSFHK